VVSPGPSDVLHDLAGVEAALRRLWLETASPGLGTGEPAVIRTVTLNVVAIAPDDDGDATAEILGTVAEQHPGRILVVQVQPGSREADRLDARVGMQCQKIAEGIQVCAQQVVIRAGAEAVDRLGGALAALLVPDCPVVLWWRRGPGPATRLFERLTGSLDALLLDGARFDPAALQGWVSRARRTRERLAIGDTAWARGAVWRHWTADAFEPPELRPDLGRITAVRVACGAGAAMVGLLYVGWLAVRLGWRPAPGLAAGPDGGWTGTLAGPDGPVAVVLTPVPGAEGLAGATLETRGPDGAEYVIAREEAPCVGLTVRRARAVCLRSVAREPEPDEARIVGRWLERPRWDPLYGEALAAVAALCGAAGGEAVAGGRPEAGRPGGG
jgi:glucose-6-phosphate dehydrogenase assembly protein OpcA